MSSMSMSRSTSLLTTSDLTPDQQAAIDRIYGFDHTFLIAKMGAGKTVCTLTAFKELQDEKVLSRLLVIAPLKVCDNVWAFEHTKWAHLKHLTVAVATGNAVKRVRAVECDSDILVVNIENLAWLFETYKDTHGCDGLVVDELSKFKSIGGKAFKKLRRRINDFVWRVGMTGTPVSEDWTGIYGQMMIVDGGQRLGTNNQKFLDEYFYPTDYMRRNWALKEGMEQALTDAIKDCVHVMPDYRDELPPINYVIEKVQLPKQAGEIYAALKKDMLVQVGDGALVIAPNEAVLTGKLAQAASGFLYNEDETTTTIHRAKIDRVHEIVNASTSPILLAYWFQHDRELLQTELNAPIYGGSKSKSKTRALEMAWNNGDHSVMMIHPRSGGHGLNLPKGGHTVLWYGPQWSRDLWEQLNARLWRKGQTKPVTVIVIEAENTIDPIISARVDGKGGFDVALMGHLAGGTP